MATPQNRPPQKTQTGNTAKRALQQLVKVMIMVQSLLDKFLLMEQLLQIYYFKHLMEDIRLL